jgi:hypothetical protein
MMKLLIIILLFFYIPSISYGVEIFKGLTDRKKVKEILGKPDIVTKREDLLKAMLGKKTIPKRYKYVYEFWIYYKKKNQNKPWGFVELDQEGTVVDLSLHMPSEKLSYKLYQKKLPDKIFQKKGSINGEDWTLMPDKSKLLLIIDVIDSLREDGIVLRKSPLYYLEELDSFYKDRSHIKFSVLNTIYCFAVLNKDWDDGTNKEEQIRKLLPVDDWRDFLK